MLRMNFDDATKNRLKRIVRSRLVLKCAKHPRFNPAEGVGALKGAGCPDCRATIRAYDAAVAFRQALANYDSITEKYETAKPRQKKAKAVAAGFPHV